MAGSLNKVQLIGNLGADPEIRALPSGGRVANFRLACSESWKDKETGERKEKTEWVTVACFNDAICGVIEQYLHKGSKCYVEGVLRTRKYQHSDGSERYSTEVHIERFNGSLLLLDSKGSGGGAADRDAQYDDMDRSRYGERRPGGSPNDSGQGRRQAQSDSGRSAPSSTGNRYSDFDDDIPF